MKDDSFAALVAREGVVPPIAPSPKLSPSPPLSSNRATLLPPDCGEDAPFAEKTRYAANGVDLRRLRTLAREKPQAELDLHGLTAAEAHLALESFLRAQIAAGQRSAEIVHGRGGHSADGRGVLRGKTRKWLAGCRAVLGYCEAPRNPGAVRVLLRRDAD